MGISSLAKRCRRRRRQIGVLLALTYITLVAAYVLWFAGAPKAFAVLLVIALANVVQVVDMYIPVRRAERDPVVGYLLMVHNHLSMVPPEERKREAMFSEARRKYQFEKPGFAEEAPSG
jgi:hypothetical protein